MNSALEDACDRLERMAAEQDDELCAELISIRNSIYRVAEAEDRPE